MEHQLVEQCRLIPESFWLAEHFDVDLLLTGKELEAEAGKGCHVCQYLTAWLNDTHLRPINWTMYFKKYNNWHIPLSPGDLVYFDLRVKIEYRHGGPSDIGTTFRKQMFGRRQKIFYKCEPLSNSGCASRQFDEAAVGTRLGHLCYDSAHQIDQLQQTESKSSRTESSGSCEAMEFNLALIKKWIDECEQRHKGACGAALATRNFVPTRLLDLKAFGCGKSIAYGDDVKLVSLQLDTLNCNDKHPSYLTLSHCWGPPEKRPTTTTRASLEANMNRILFSSLPKTFRDAVEITRRLGQRYLWIDSLCIIQDDETDWAQEASLMAKVYSHSYCTLAALGSSDSSEGLNIVQPESLLNYDICGNYNDKYRLHMWYETQAGWYEEYNGSRDQSPLRYRAWALQERELSTRTIYFGKQQLLWECLWGQVCTQQPWPLLMDYKKNIKRAMVNPRIKLDTPHLSAVDWQNLVEDYSNRSLTKQTDKLTALSGIAQSYQVLLPDAKYVAGIWSIHLPECLLWATYGRSSRRASEYIAPSWSWASVISPIEYGRWLHNIDALERSWPTRYPEVGNMRGLPKHDDAYGALVSATLLLHKAVLVQLDCKILDPADCSSSKVREGEPNKNIGFLTKDGVYAGMAYLDVMEELSQNTEVACLIFSDKPRIYGLSFVGLLLRRVAGDDESTYRRVGLALDVPTWIAEGLERRTVRLI